MKHLLSPLDLSVDETEDLLNLASRIAKDPENSAIAVTVKNLPLYFMNRVLEPALVLRQP